MNLQDSPDLANDYRRQVAGVRIICVANPQPTRPAKARCQRILTAGRVGDGLTKSNATTKALLADPYSAHHPRDLSRDRRAAVTVPVAGRLIGHAAQPPAKEHTGTIVSLLTQIAITRPAPADSACPDTMSKWRLKRANDFIATNIGRSIDPAAIAIATGLPRKRFASQLRATTGFWPREYVLQRRIGQGQVLLATTPQALADIALAVGFSSLARFTRAFVRLVGQSPDAWRGQHAAAPDLVAAPRSSPAAASTDAATHSA
jgi:AraC-like DNA-binding protein